MKKNEPQLDLCSAVVVSSSLEKLAVTGHEKRRQNHGNFWFVDKDSPDCEKPQFLLVRIQSPIIHQGFFGHTESHCSSGSNEKILTTSQTFYSHDPVSQHQHLQDVPAQSSTRAYENICMHYINQFFNRSLFYTNFTIFFWQCFLKTATCLHFLFMAVSVGEIAFHHFVKVSKALTMLYDDPSVHPMVVYRNISYGYRNKI